MKGMKNIIIDAARCAYLGLSANQIITAAALAAISSSQSAGRIFINGYEYLRLEYAVVAKLCGLANITKGALRMTINGLCEYGLICRCSVNNIPYFLPSKFLLDWGSGIGSNPMEDLLIPEHCDIGEMCPLKGEDCKQGADHLHPAQRGRSYFNSSINRTNIYNKKKHVLYTCSQKDSGFTADLPAPCGSGTERRGLSRAQRTLIEKEFEREVEERAAGSRGDVEKEKVAGKRKRTCNEVIEAFNSRTAGKLPGVAKLTRGREYAIMARVKEDGMDNVLKAFDLAASSSFLAGGGNRGWVASFDWIMNPKNFQRILEGCYVDRKSNKNQQRRSAHVGEPSDYSDMPTRKPTEEELALLERINKRRAS